MITDSLSDNKVIDLPGQDLVIFDFEYTAWEGSLEAGWERNGENPEIIQIGAVEITSSSGRWEMRREFNQYIRPTLRPVLSDYIIELTEITQEMIDNLGVSFPAALTSFYEFSPKDAKLCANGNDWSFLELNCRINKIKNPFTRGRFTNLRPYFAQQLGLDEESDTLHSHKLANVVDLLDSESHNALVDARSIAQTLIYMTSAL